MYKKVKYEKVSNLIEKSYSQYSAEPDDMWHGSIIPSSTFYKIGDKGYIAVDHQTVVDYYHEEGQYDIFVHLVNELGVDTAIVPSYHKQFYDLSLQFFKNKTLDTLLFKHQHRMKLTNQLRFDYVTIDELPSVLEYSKTELKDEGEWLKAYFAKLILQNGLLRFYDDGEVIGLGEVRVYKGAVNIGMSVSLKHRRKGYATKIVNQLVELNIEKGLDVIASTTTSNQGSIKTLKKCGFVNYHNIYKMENKQT